MTYQLRIGGGWAGNQRQPRHDMAPLGISKLKVREPQPSQALRTGCKRTEHPRSTSSAQFFPVV